MRLTKHRQDILRELDSCDEAMSAASINAALPHINLVTIYRGLEFLVSTGKVKKLHLGEQEAQYEVQHEPHHHAICAECQKVIHFSLDDKKLIREFSLPDFAIKNLEITLHGTCTKNHNSTQPTSE